MCTKGAQREENYNIEEKGGEGGERKESTNSATRVF